MAQDANEYLAINVLSEQQYVSYRSLSRALKVHCNLAKQMLFEFHRQENARRPGSVHATYLISGTKTIQATPPPPSNGRADEDGEDEHMQSSPPLPSSSIPNGDEDVPAVEERTIRAVMLAKEEQLDQARGTFGTISSIHVYSLQTGALNDLQVLTECNRKIAASYASEDPLVAWKQYGTIQNPNVQRRTRKNEAPPAALLPGKEKAEAAKPAATTVKPPAADTVRAKSKAEPADGPPEPEKQSKTAKATTNKAASSIFKSFAKSNSQPKRDDSQNSAVSSAVQNAPDEHMGGFSDDDDDGEEEAEEAVEEPIHVPAGKSRKDRAAELQAMMEPEDEPMEDADTGAEVEPPDEPEAAIDNVESQREEEPRESVTVENGRRRGRRRVMKKKTAKDEDGYLVTKEEAVWESFSEDEPAPKKIKGVSAPAANTASKALKKGGKPGQGNIMSFFGKK